MTPKLHTLKGRFYGLAALLAAAPAALAVAPEQAPAVAREGEVLVQYRAGAPDAAVQELRAKFGVIAKRSIGADRIELLELPALTTTAAALDLLRADPAVERAEPNFRRFARAAIPNDPLFAQQWGLRNTGQANFVPGGPAGVAGGDLNMAEAWDANGDGAADRTGIPSVIVAVIDDAIQISHPDLGTIVNPYNLIACQDDDNPSPVSADGSHGTLVSGCAVATGGNSSGVAGVAWNASLMPIKFAFDTATHLQALAWVRDHGAKVINASFGGPGFSQLEADMIASLAAADVLYVTAAGNDDSNTDLAQLNYPANYAAENIVSAAATNRQDNIASFSQHGPLSVDVAAPGFQIVTTATGSAYSVPVNCGLGGGCGASGTSFASPYTAGVAALLKSHVAPTPGYLEMKARLIESGSAAGGANPKQKTAGGRIDADKALELTPRPALVIRAVAFDDPAGNGNDLPDPGETLDVSLTVRNLWQDAAAVTSTLAADNGVTVNTAGAQPVGSGTIGPEAEGVVTFSITIPAVSEHRYVNLALGLSANAGSYTATRGAGFEIGTLTPGVQVSQSFAGDSYDEFHAWHVDVADGTGKTLLIETTTGGEDIDLLAKPGVAPQYSISVGINPEVQAGYFCTSGTTADCQDPATLVSGRLDGTEAVSVENPSAGSYHVVVVNFGQAAIPYTLRARLANGDLRPEPFNFLDASNIPPNTTVTSGDIQVIGLSAPAPITVTGGEYSLDGGNTFTSIAGEVSNLQLVRVRTNNGSSGTARVQLTIGGVTDTFYVNRPPAPQFDGSGDTRCPSTFSRRGGGGLPASLLAGLLVAALARRFARR